MSASPETASDSPFQNYASFTALVERCTESGKTIAQLAIERETARTGAPPSQIRERTAALLQQMRDTIAEGVQSDEPSMSGLSGSHAKTLMAFQQDPMCMFSTIGVRLMAYGLATLEENSRMKTIVACPTAGGSGSVPAVLIALEHEYRDRGQPLENETLVDALITAGAVGELVARRMHLSGASAGCQAEVGVASGMAAAAMVVALKGTPAQAVTASAISMQNLLGLVCDPVAGLVEVPCVVRNGLSGVQAAAAATMALAGMQSFIPMDEVVDAMVEVGRLMSPKLKETAEGGLAQTETAKAFTQQFYS